MLAGSIEPSLQECLSHATGLARMNLLSAQPDLGFDDLLEHVRRAELLVPYRTAFNYSNINYTLAGETLARASGRSWHELMASWILGPLGMTRSGTTLAARAALDDVAVGYDDLDDDAGPGAPREPAMVWDLTPIAAAGALNASLADMLRYAACLVAEGRHADGRLLEADTLEALWAPQIPLGPDVAYASGVFVEERDGHRLVHHGGNVPGFASQLVLFPDDDAAVVLLTNVMMSPLQDRVVGWAAACLFGDELPALPAEAAPLDPELLARLEGAYWFEQGDMAMTALVKDGGLALDVPGQTVYELLPPDADGKWFFAATDTIAVSFEQRGEQPAGSLTMYQAGLEFVMPRHEPEPVEGLPTVDELLAPVRARSAAADGALIVVGEIAHPHQGVVGEFTWFADGERRVVEQIDYGVIGEQRTVVDGDRGWMRSPSGQIESLDESEREELLRGLSGLLDGDWASLYAEVTVTGRDELDGREVFVLRATDDDGGAADTLRVDAAGRLLASTQSMDLGVMGGLTLETRFSDWREVDGLPVAHRAVVEMGMLGRVEYQVLQLRRAAQVDEDWFTPPADLPAAAR